MTDEKKSSTKASRTRIKRNRHRQRIGIQFGNLAQPLGAVQHLHGVSNPFPILAERCLHRFKDIPSLLGNRLRAR